ncbi:hypothetical protein ETAA8_38540 [Anatilimnocola aggregata]|uniref:Uncharacterized protein n=1 Tax=Anatilimnocola aggregata TaxID=2528021 RepID=A0A517YEV0_9BACT|nr:hypothetical protein [Anatilimnocola aggregata]QDU28749.1 hypothetical protein ETAA8_38540 [Anatilimnocola aggregata]
MAAHQTPTHDDHFDESESNQHLADDSEAWNGVTGLLLFIVSIGLSLAMLTLYLSRNP